LDLVYNIPQLLIGLVAAAFSWRADLHVRARQPLVLAAGSAAALPVLLKMDFFHLLRLWSFAVFVHLPLLLAIAGWTLGRGSRRARALCWAGSATLWLAATYAFAIEPARLEVTRFELDHAGVARNVRIAVVADLQTDRIGAHERRALEAVMAARPDIILMPGDFIQARAEERPRLARELRALLVEIGFDAPLGVYAVRGNCDPPGWAGIFDDTVVRVLDETTRLPLDGLTITGLGLGASFDPRLRLARAPGDETFNVVFGHAPEFALGDVQADLLVAGHTHGGQVRLPFWGPLITFSQVPRSWAAGLTRLSGDRTLVVSRGVGMERFHAPRLRFLCRPQIVLIDVGRAG